MNKKILFGAMICAMGSTMTSCDLDSPESVSSVTFRPLNLVTSVSGDNEAFVTTGSYGITMSSKGTLNVTGSKVSIPGKEVNFTTSDVKYQSGVIQTTAGSGEVTYFNGANGSGSGLDILSVSGVVSGLTYYYNYPVPGFVNPSFQEVSPALVMQYNIGNQYLVRTFPQNAYYRGQTRLQYSVNDQGGFVFEKSPISYRVQISDDYKTATLFLYDCQFAETMPADKSPKCLVLRNLKVEYSGNGYSISGDNLVPAQPEGGVLVDNKNFTFNNVRVYTTSTDLTKVNISYNVEGKMSVNMGPAGVRDIKIDASGRADNISYVIISAPVAGA